MMENDKPAALIVGGTSGLGLKLALLLTRTHRVFVAGRHDPGKSELSFRALDLGSKCPIGEHLTTLVLETPPLDLLVYAAGSRENGTVSELDDAHISDMVSVGLLAPALLLRRVMRNQEKLPGFVAVTSTSQWIPRRREPIYAAVKAGLAMLATSFSLDPRAGKVLVIGPSGMKTRMQEGRPDWNALLDPKWVAEQILELYEGDFEYKFARILRDPLRVEIVEVW